MRTSDRPVTLALIGAGQRGQFAYGPYALDNAHQAKFVAVVEPDAGRRASFQAAHRLQDGQVFSNVEDFFAAKVQADAALICTQDQQHYEMAMRAMQAGYHLLLEKPMSPSAKECIALREGAKQHGRILVVCHVLRYTKFFMAIKDILDSGRIGELVTITHNENVGFFHQAHSFVRGNWRNTALSAPMILAKSCHDMDMLLWLAGAPCVRLSSFGGLAHFTPEHAPEGSTERCTDGCEAEDSCPYSALKIYLRSGITGWPTSVITPDPTPDKVLAALEQGPYGRCVYRCDNNVVDHQTVNLEFANGVTAVFNMSAFTNEVSRTIKLMGTRGEIRAHMEKNQIEVVDFNTGDVETIALKPPATGHSGGDAGIMKEFVQMVKQGKPTGTKTSVEDSVHSHLMALAAEDARIRKTVVTMSEFEDSFRAVNE